MEGGLKKYNTIGCCGIDCGLCPRFYTKGDSVCPGCGGPDFKAKHPSCGFVTCCVIKKGLETCADCCEYPCPRFDAEKKGLDSFVTHRKVFPNLEAIRTNGMDAFLDQQKTRIGILVDFIDHCDEGRSKSFFCISCALLPVDVLLECQRFMVSLNDLSDRKEKSRQLRNQIESAAQNMNISLKLNKK
ncbi:MAG: hypothetical protein CVU11_08065 [Bacteroidetes bacterium HGW-Bacteroidetes-6]|jgi:hypothetical protein|nr:MAG: hypothetical protein CVU11_08065 [Bacteroidetes bacterium HGW-Bacteroidetes-6]